MGKQLARMHRSLSPNGQFGLDENNFIGSTPQDNSWTATWAEFYVNHRLQPQINMFEENGNEFPHKDELLDTAQQMLCNHHPSPSLLHGYTSLLVDSITCRDLWGGNTGFIKPDIPVIFDPAVYYGDRETDVIMTQVTFLSIASEGNCSFLVIR